MGSFKSECGLRYCNTTMMMYIVYTIIISVSYLQLVYTQSGDLDIEEAKRTTNANKTTDLNQTSTPNTEDFHTKYCYERVFRRDHAKKCCRKFARRFRYKWRNGGRYLTTHMSRLRDWNCEEFQNECENRRYAFNEFTELVYDRFCNRNEMETKCLDDIMDLIGNYNNENDGTLYGIGESLSNTWYNLSTKLVPSNIRLNDLTRPCVQIALFDRPEGDVGRFHEIVEPFFPFCEMVWAGYDIKTTFTRGVSPWTSMSLR